MKQLNFFLTILGLSTALCSCTEKDDSANQKYYQWGISITREQYSSLSVENMLYQEANDKIIEFEKKYNGSGFFSSDASALEKADCEAALSAYDKLEASINERIKTVDNYGMTFTIDTKYSITKDGSPVKDEVFKTFELKSDNCIRFNEYTTVTEIPLTDELKRQDPASFPVTINLESAGMLFDEMTEIQYDSVKVYAPSTREISAELPFISGGSASLDKKSLTLIFSGTSSALASMKGEWYANAYVTLTSPGLVMPGIVKVPFTVK